MKKFILFDFDGVIGDTFHVALEVFDLVFPGTTEEDLRSAFETNINSWIAEQKVKNKKYRSDLHFSEEYSRVMQEKAAIFPNMAETLEQLSHSYNLAIISSNISDNVKKFLDTHSLTHYFTDILGTDDHDLKIEKIKMIFDKYHIQNADCIFITDSLGDIFEATHVGIGTVGVAWGFNSVETLQKGNPFQIVHTPRELEDTIEKYFARTS